MDKLEQLFKIRDRLEMVSPIQEYRNNHCIEYLECINNDINNICFKK